MSQTKRKPKLFTLFNQPGLAPWLAPALKLLETSRQHLLLQLQLVEHVLLLERLQPSPRHSPRVRSFIVTFIAPRLCSITFTRDPFRLTRGVVCGSFTLIAAS